MQEAGESDGQEQPLPSRKYRQATTGDAATGMSQKACHSHRGEENSAQIMLPAPIPAMNAD